MHTVILKGSTVRMRTSETMKCGSEVYKANCKVESVSDICRLQTADCRLATNSADKQYLSLKTHFK